MDPLEFKKVITFTKKIELDFEGNVLKNAICLGDVDNDGLNELVIGNDKGDLAIFKDDLSKPIYSTKGLGVISAIAIGDALYIGRNVLVVITGCGYCHIYDLGKDNSKETSKTLSPSHVQRIPANVKVILIADINGDGFSEMIVGLTDRVVRTYRWVHTSNVVGEKLTGKFVGLNKWEFADQIGTITINKSSNGEPCILVSQPGGTFITVKVDPHYHNQSEEALTKTSFTLDSLCPSKLRNSEICGNIKINEKESVTETPFAVITLDGILALVQDGKPLWNINIHHELFSVTSLDINNDGHEEIVACAWDGFTFIVNHKQECAVYEFKEPVNTFTAGFFGFKNKQVPCLVYVTFNSKVYIFYDISVPSFSSFTINEKIKNSEKYKQLAKSLGIDINDANQIRELNNYALYHVL